MIKIESVSRPDGSAPGAPAFFDLLNGGKESVALDFHSAEGIETLQHLLTFVDVVIEGSRPRALEQLGIVAGDALTRGPRVWLSITGYGRDAGSRERVAFGDDAAVAGGLVVGDDRDPCFCADAVADPLTGLTGALATLDALQGDQVVLLDVAMAGVAASFSGPTLDVPASVRAVEPVMLEPSGPAPRLGRDTAAVLAELDSAPRLSRRPRVTGQLPARRRSGFAPRCTQQGMRTAVA